MTYTEVIDTVNNELKLCYPKIEEMGRKFASMVKKTRNYPLVWKTTFSSRHKTTFHVMWVAGKRNDWDKPKFYIFVPFHRLDGINVAFLSQKREATMIFTRHFFERYKERFLDDEESSTTEIIQEFFLNNRNILARRATRNFVKEFDKYEEILKGDPIVVVINDGYCFGEKINGRVMLIRTIIREDMLRPGQKEAFSRMKNIFDRYDDIS